MKLFEPAMFFCAAALALAQTAQAQFDYTNNNGAITITSYTGSGGNVIIPPTINDLPVTRIEDEAFFDSGSVSITVPASVTSIGEYAFGYCSSLTCVFFQGNAPTADTTLFHIYPTSYAIVYYLSGTTGWSNTFGGAPAVLTTPPTQLTYTTNAGAITITGYTGPVGPMVIPPVINDLPVTSIGDEAFSGCANLTSATVLGSVGSIGDSAFAECTRLTNVTLSEGLTNLGQNAFYGCSSLTGITIPDTVTNIGVGAFQLCGSLTGVTLPGSLAGHYLPGNFGGQTWGTLPGSVTNIGTNAFSQCTNLGDITIPASVTSIEQQAFAYCPNLIDVYFQGNAPTVAPDAFAGDNGLTFYYLTGTTGWSNTFAGRPVVATPTPQTDFTCTTNNGTITVTGYNALGPVVTIPPNINGLTVTAIGESAFEEFGTGLLSVTIPDTVTSIGQYAFSSDGLTNLTIPASVTNIGDYAFGWNPYLPSVVFQGNAPVADTTVFNNPVTVYYWIGTSGWSNTFAGQPTVATPPPAQFTYATANGAITINGYTGPGGALGIPPTINGLPVTGIGEYAFMNCQSLTGVTIPGSVSYVGAWAFLWDNNLEAITVNSQSSFYSSVNGVLYDKSRTTLLQCPDGLGGDYTIPNTVTSIGDEAFLWCVRLAGVTIPGSVTNIGNEAFAACTNLVSVTMQDGVTSLGFGAFNDCASLTNFTIPGSVTSMGAGVFTGCASLTSVTIPTNLASIPSEAFLACGGLTNVTIPGSVTNIGDYAFSGCTSLRGVTIPKSVTGIGNWAFGSCGLGSVTIPGSVAGIGDSAFESCASLTNVTLSNGVTVIGSFAFDDSGLSSVTIPASVTSIGMDAFCGCFRMTNAAIGSGVTNIGEGAFAECAKLRAITVASGNLNYSSVTGVLFDKSQSTLVAYPGGLGGSYAIPGSVTGIGEYAFYVCSNLTGVTIPASVTSIGIYAFTFCTNLGSVTIPGGVTNLGFGAFEYCESLTNVTIADGLSSIGAQAFYYCPSLFNITIPASVTGIGDYAFAWCSDLTSVFFLGNPPAAGVTPFYNANNATAYYLAGAAGWSNTYAGIPAMDPPPLTYTTNSGTISITGYIGSGGAVIIPSTIDGLIVNNIGSNAFKSNVTVTAVTIPATATNIAYEAFFGCTNLGSVTIPGSVTSIGRSAFSHCFSLTNVTISQGVPGIGYSVFYECSNLTSITIPASVTNIADYAFQYCTRLAGVYFTGKPPTVSTVAFDGDGSVTLYYLPGVSGWGSAIAGYTPVLWNPLIQTGGANFGMKTNYFRFNITGTANIPVVVEACTNLASPVWTPLTNAALTSGSFYFSEAAKANSYGRYYRIRSP